MKDRRRYLTAIAMAAGLLLLLVGCSVDQNLPAAAEQSLQEYWASLPSAGEITNEIVRAWPGDLSGADLPPGSEVWCVEAEISAPDSEIDGELLLWIVVRTGESQPWTAAMLATMSSTWPYAACAVWDVR